MREAGSPLFTDLYQLTMLQAYGDAKRGAEAVFEFYVRRLGVHRGYLVAAGLEQALGFLENLRFTDDEIRWLRGTGRFSDGFLASLDSFRFRCDVDAVPEGRVVFEDTPLIQVTGRLDEGQLVESRLINTLHYQTLVASKAARMVLTAPDASLVDFGFRRAHGVDAGLHAARAAWIAGFAGTATVEAARRFGIPVYGTMAHSFVLAHDTEMDAFRTFAAALPDDVTLLIDTYDTVRAAGRVVELARELGPDGPRIGAVRLDSGDLAALSEEVRAVLDDGGLDHVRILVSGNMDEYELTRLAEAGAPIDGYGIGTRLVTSEDRPTLECAYKLQQLDGAPKRKRSSGKATWPGRKQVWRRYDAAGLIAEDTVTLHDDAPLGEPLLVPVMRRGTRVAGDATDLAAARERCREDLARLGELQRRLESPSGIPVTIGESVTHLASPSD